MLMIYTIMIKKKIFSGTPNAKVSLRLVEFTVKNGQVRNSTTEFILIR